MSMNDLEHIVEVHRREERRGQAAYIMNTMTSFVIGYLVYSSVF